MLLLCFQCFKCTSLYSLQDWNEGQKNWYNHNLAANYINVCEK
jgi:hypothetical protein